LITFGPKRLSIEADMDIFLFQVDHVKDKAELELVHAVDYISALTRLLVW
jgi:hypothetical protein